MNHNVHIEIALNITIVSILNRIRSSFANISFSAGSPKSANLRVYMHFLNRFYGCFVNHRYWVIVCAAKVPSLTSMKVPAIFIAV